MNAPDFIIAGSAKSGTTALAGMLDQHSGIHVSAVKETNYFVHGFGPRDDRRLHNGRVLFAGRQGAHYIDDARKYSALFAGAAAHQLTGEASPLYLLEPAVPARLQTQCPAVRIIVILRNPTDVAFANFVHHVRDRAESIRVTDIGSFLDMARYRHPGLHPFARHLQIPAYAEHLPSWFERFDPRQIHLMIHEEFRANPEQAVAEVLAFLEVPADAQIDTAREVNVSNLPRSMLLHRAVLGLPGLKRVLRPVLPTRQRRRLRLTIERMNAGARPVLPDAGRALLDDRFALDRAWVEKRLGRPIDAWRERLNDAGRSVSPVANPEGNRCVPPPRSALYPPNHDE